MELHSFDELIQTVKSAPTITAAVASAADAHTLESAYHAYREGIIQPIFIGNREKICDILAEERSNPDQFQIIDEPDIQKTPYIAAELASAGQADIVIKGFIDSSDFLKGLLNKEHGLRTGRAMSHMAFLQVPSFSKLVAVTDAGMITNPDYDAKVHILENALDILSGMGYECPKVAALTAVEKPNKAMPETLDARALQEANECGKINRCVIEGPVSYDIMVSKESAANKGFSGKYSGEYDILLVPNISAGNLMCKALMYNAGAKMSGLVAGAKVPIVLNSRSSPAEEKYCAIAMAAASRMHWGK